MESLVAEGKLLLKEYGKIKARWISRQEKHGSKPSSMEFHMFHGPGASKNSSKPEKIDLHHLTTQLPKVPVSSLEYSKAIGQEKVLST